MISKSEGDLSAGTPPVAAGGARPRALLAVEPRVAESVFDEEAWRRLARCVRIDRTLSAARGYDDPRLPAALLAETDILITGWGSPRLDPAALDLMPRLRHVVHAAGTVKLFLDPAVLDRGITVSSAAEANAVPVAEYTLAAIILGAKRAFTLSARVRAGRRDAHEGTHRDLGGLPWLGTRGLTIGVIGASRIGVRVTRLVRSVLDARVLLYDPYTDGGLTAQDPEVRRVSLDELLAGSDVVSVHAPLTPETARLVGARELALMPDGAVLVNTARGGLVDTDALRAEVLSGRLDAVLDVTEPEPLPVGDSLFAAPNAFVTPHIAGALGNETTRLGDLAVDEVERIAAGLAVRHPVEAERFARIA
jgi:phosphoglycerate dehydrogenase-like enzyme